MRRSTWNLSAMRSQWTQRETSEQLVVWMTWLVIGIGVVLRLAQYLANRSLWMDEAYLALNISQRSFAGLLQPLDYGQAAPVGFLLLAKLAITALGNSDYALRLVPLLAGLAALPLFGMLARRFLEPRAALVALALFAASDSLIYFASELKQYSSDVAVALALLLIATIIYDKGLTTGRALLFGLAGALAVWFSYPAAFVLAGLGLVLLAVYVAGRAWGSVARLALAGALWAASFAAYFVVSLSKLSQSEYLRAFWADRNAFMPLPPTSFSDIEWFFTTFFDLFKQRTQLPSESMLALVFLIGLVVLLRAEWRKYALLLAPIIVTFGVSGLEKYTISDRTTLFFLPLLLIFVGAGAVYLFDSLKPRSAVVANGMLLFLFVPLLFDASYHILKPRQREEIKPVMAYVQQHAQPGDTVYVYYGAQYAFRYYEDSYDLRQPNLVLGQDPRDFVSAEERDDLGRYVAELDQLRGSERVWLVFAHSYNRTGIDEETFFLYHLNTFGQQRDSFKRTDAAVYLYDLAAPMDQAN